MKRARIVSGLLLIGIPGLCLGTQTQDSAPPPPLSKAETPKDNTQGRVKMGPDLLAPRIVSDPEPEYSQVARNAKYEGICVLWLIVGADGKPRDIKVVRPLGLGLDEKAVEAVQKWQFEPALKNGKPVAVQINVEVNFHMDGARTDVPGILKNAAKGDSKAQLELASFYLESGESADQSHGVALLEEAANKGLRDAQFLMGERTSQPIANGRPDYIAAYKWYTLARRGGEKKADKPLKQLKSMMSAAELAEAQTRVANWKPTPSN